MYGQEGRWVDTNLGRWNRRSGEVVQPYTGCPRYVQYEPYSVWEARISTTHCVDLQYLPSRAGLD
jgi:hypothetical protein